MLSATEKSLPSRMMRIASEAISISPRAKSWLETTQQPRVLQVFAPVVNLVNEEGEVLSIVVPAIGNGPFSMVVEGGGFDRAMDQDSQVHISAFGILIGDNFVEINQLVDWNPIPDWKSIRNADLRQAALRIQAILAEEAIEDSIARSLFGSGGRLDSKFTKVTDAGIKKISTGLNERDLGLVQVGVSHLAGLGIGLTPAGDDFLVGIMHGLWATSEPEWVRSICKAIVDSAVPRTNTLSGAWLRAAASGEVGEVWHDLMGAMVNENGEGIEDAVRSILPTGHTSGADALAGFVHIFADHRP